MPDQGWFRGGSGPELVLLHGLGMSWRAWRPVLDRLGEHYDVLALTLPGHRGGPELERPFSGARVAAHVARMMTAHGFEMPQVVGNSLGGLLALHLAQLGRANSLTLLAPAGAWSSSRELVRLELRLAAGRAMLAHPAAPLWTRTSASRHHLLNPLMVNGGRVGARAAADILRDMRGCRAFGEVSRNGRRNGMIDVTVPAACPVHVAWGERDRVLPFARYGRALLDRLPGCRYVPIPDAGHVPWFDQPEAVVAVIRGTTDGRAAPVVGRGAS